MSTYKIFEQDGSLANTIVADEAFMLEHFPGGNYELVPEDEIVAPPAPALPRRITKLGFRNRFTSQEKVTLEIAGLDDPAASLTARAQAAAIRVYQADVNAATFIDLDRADTREGVQALETAGILTAGRALQILDDPIQDFEAYKP